MDLGSNQSGSYIFQNAPVIVCSVLGQPRVLCHATKVELLTIPWKLMMVVLFVKQATSYAEWDNALHLS